MQLVTGATGNVGAELVRALLDAGEPVRALVRSESGREALPEGVDGFVGNLDRSETLAAALDGAHGLHLLSGYADMDGLLAEVRSAGVRHVVLQSASSAATGDMTNAVARYHIVSEHAVKDSEVGWTILRPNSFMSNALRWAPQLQAGDVVREPFADVPVATIDPADIAAVSALALTEGGHDGRTYRISGPRSMLPVDRLAVLAEVLGRDLRLEPLSDAEAKVQMRATMPAEYVDAFFRFFAEGQLDESAVLPTVAEITGREPRSFEQWARAHADALAPAAQQSRGV
jgi:uncharacterized protein YbjT (DUF2867 family)